MSAAGFAIPTIGDDRSSSSYPMARNIARWGARSTPSVTSWLRIFSLMGEKRLGR
jgi:hypothetical protein